MKSIIDWTTTSFRNFIVNNKKSKLLTLYQKKQYKQIPKLFKTEKDYLSITFDEFPFLYFMISQNNKEAVQNFINHISFKDYLMFDQKNPLKCNPLIYAYLENKFQIAELFLQSGFNLSTLNSEGLNMLHVAAIYKRKQAFFEGIKRKVNHDTQDIYGNTPLHYSCRNAQVEMMEALIAGKAQKLPNKYHLYPIHMAIQSQSLTAVDLIKNDLWAKYPNYHPIHSAARTGFLQIMRELLKHEPSLVNLVDSKQLTALHHAVSTQNAESVSFLLKQKGILINMKDQMGNTPLHIAFMRDDLQNVRLLVDAKADLDIINSDYLAPVDFGIDSSNSEIKGYIKSLTGRSKRLSQWRTRM